MSLRERIMSLFQRIRNCVLQLIVVHRFFNSCGHSAVPFLHGLFLLLFFNGHCTLPFLTKTLVLQNAIFLVAFQQDACY